MEEEVYETKGLAATLHSERFTEILRRRRRISKLQRTFELWTVSRIHERGGCAASLAGLGILWAYAPYLVCRSIKQYHIPDRAGRGRGAPEYFASKWPC